MSKKKHFSGLTRRTKATTKRFLQLDGAPEDGRSEVGVEGLLDDIKHDPSFNSSQLIKKKTFRPGKTADKTLGAIQSIGNAVVHPMQSARSAVTRTTANQLSKAERPFISQRSDVEFLQAHENLNRAESTSASKLGTSEEEQESLIGGHQSKIREMEKNRESLRAAWTTSRHVRRVRVVPKRQINLPDNEYFVERDNHGAFVRYDWLKWLGYNLVYYTQDFSAQYIDDFEELPFDIDSSRHYLERMVMASAAWQSLLMDIRAVYRWEDRQTTLKWFALYIFLWYTQHLMGFIYFYIIYIVLKNRFYPTTIESLRSSQRRAVDRSASAKAFSELIDKHGRHDWLDPVMDNLGPYIQLQLGDIANMLEVFNNFYHWENPKKTVASLYFFASCFLVSLFADMNFCMQIVWFIVGGSFFLCWPVSSHYPKYRYLVSPFKWVLWEIPTNAELREQIIEKKVEERFVNSAVDKYTGSITTVPRIKVDGRNSEDEIDENDDDDEDWFSACSTTSILEASDIRSFRCQSHHVRGRLIIFSKGIRFVRSLPKKELWRLDYLDLAEMRKVEGSTVSKLATLSPDQLEIKSIDGSKFHLEAMKERDSAFNSIVGFSGLQWQSLQTLSNTKAQP
ncbi:hypothetical protein BDR22DRAFT_816076 [Usnea florida]